MWRRRGWFREIAAGVAIFTFFFFFSSHGALAFALKCVLFELHDAEYYAKRAWYAHFRLVSLQDDFERSEVHLDYSY